MTGAVFVLAINMMIAMSMAIAFFAIGHFDPINRAANWFGVAFVFVTLSFSGEYVLHAGLSDAGARMFIALTLLGGLLLITHGLSARYGRSIKLGWLVAIFAVSTLIYVLILDLPRHDLWRQFLYQVPYIFVFAHGVVLILRSGRRGVLDYCLVGILAFGALSFASKPFIASLTGGVGERGEDYATTLYAAISMASAGGTALFFAMVLLAIVISDSIDRIRAGAEYDSETGLLNQTGFETRGKHLLSQLSRHGEHQTTLALIVIEDNTQAEADQAPGLGLGQALSGIFGPEALIARMSGLKFAVLMPQTNLLAAKRQAEMLRVRLIAGTVSLSPDARASIGIAEYEAGDSLSDVAQRAQWAVEEARRTGGNSIRLSARAALARGREA